MAQSMRPISTITDQGGFTGASAHGSVDGAAPDTGDYWYGNDNEDDVLEVLLTDLSGTPPDTGTCTVSIYQAESDGGSAPASGGVAVTYNIEVYEGATQRAIRSDITATESSFTLDNNLTFSASSITDWSNVRVRFTALGSTGGPPGNRRGVAVSYIEVSTPDAAAADQDISGTVGNIASAEGFETGASLANAAPQAISGTVGEIASAEALETGNALSNATPQAISGTVGEIASGEALETDHSINIEVLEQTISGTVGEIASGEALETDDALSNATPQAISGTAGEIASAEALETDHSIDNDFQSISGAVGDIASAENFEVDSNIVSGFQAISAAGEIGSSESFENNNTISAPFTPIDLAGDISTAESFEVDSSVAGAVPQEVSGTSGDIATGESFEVNLFIENAAQEVSGTVGGVVSAESFEVDHGLVGAPQEISLAGEISSSESFEINNTISGPVTKTIIVVNGITTSEGFSVGIRVGGDLAGESGYNIISHSVALPVIFDPTRDVNEIF